MYVKMMYLVHYSAMKRLGLLIQHNIVILEAVYQPLLSRKIIRPTFKLESDEKTGQKDSLFEVLLFQMSFTFFRAKRLSVILCFQCLLLPSAFILFLFAWP